MPTPDLSTHKISSCYTRFRRVTHDFKPYLTLTRSTPRGPSRPDLTYEIPNLLGFVVDSWILSGFWQIPNYIHATYNEIHININVFYVDSWILIRNPEWIPTCSVRDSSRDGPLVQLHKSHDQ